MRKLGFTLMGMGIGCGVPLGSFSLSALTVGFLMFACGAFMVLLELDKSS